MERRGRIANDRRRGGLTGASLMAYDDPQGLPHLEALIDEGGQVMLGAMAPVGSVAVASRGRQTLAMLRRAPGEPLKDLLARLDAAIYNALEHDFITDEINSPQQRR